MAKMNPNGVLIFIIKSQKLYIFWGTNEGAAQDLGKSAYVMKTSAIHWCTEVQLCSAPVVLPQTNYVVD